MRLFLLVGAIVTLAPVAFILRSGGGNSVQSGGLPGAAVVVEAGSDAVGGSSAPVAVGLAVSTAVAPTSSAPSPTVPVTLDSTVAPQVETAVTSPPRPPRTTSLNCPKVYEVVFGDYWVAIAKVHQVTLDELLRQNEASAEQPLYPGRLLCLPENASEPIVTATIPPAPKPAAKAPTRASSTTEAPVSTARATTTTVAPTTTKPAPTTTRPAPTTTKPPPTVHYDNSQIEAIIRAVWPDELEEKALVVANRESTLDPTVRNYCCYGLFQIYYETHKKWLADLGVQSAEDLYDPQVNAYAAYVLYQRSGGWGPWGG